MSSLLSSDDAYKRFNNGDKSNVYSNKLQRLMTNEEFYAQFAHVDKDTLPNKGEWIMGRLDGGSVGLEAGSWRFRGKHIDWNKSFSVSDFGSEQAEELAMERKRAYNKHFGLSKNDYRYLDERTIEVKLKGGYTMVIDSDEQTLTKLRHRTWRVAIGTSNSVYVIGGKEAIGFHRDLMNRERGSGYNITVDHINGTHIATTILDNRSENLRLATKIEQSNNQAMREANTSGVTGVSLNEKHNLWEAYYTKNKKRLHESFSFGPRGQYLTKELAFKAAVQWRTDMNSKTGCTNGFRPFLGLKSSEQTIHRLHQLEKRVTTETKTITEYFRYSKHEEEKDESPNNHPRKKRRKAEEDTDSDCMIEQ